MVQHVLWSKLLPAKCSDITVRRDCNLDIVSGCRSDSRSSGGYSILYSLIYPYSYVSNKFSDLKYDRNVKYSCPTFSK